MNNLYIIKDRLNAALKLRDMNATELARLTGLNKSSVSRYLSGSSIPRSLAIGNMARALHVNPAWILGYNVPIEAEDIEPTMDINKLSEANQARLMAYYQALIDSQEEGVLHE